MAKLLSNVYELFDIKWIFNNEMKALALKSHLNMYLHGGTLSFEAICLERLKMELLIKKMCNM